MEDLGNQTVHLHLSVAVIGCGTAGPVVAALLAAQGHDVVIFERDAELRTHGAGILLQQLGQDVMRRLGLLPRLEAETSRVTKVDGITRTGRTVMNLDYADTRATPALGVHRGSLHRLLTEHLAATSVSVRLNAAVTGVTPYAGRIRVSHDNGSHGDFDLVVGADGTRSRTRAAAGLTRTDRRYPWGALWAIVEDPDGLAGDSLYQCYDGPGRYAGVLPTGPGRASIFWSIKPAEMQQVAGDIDAWQRTAEPFFTDRLQPLRTRVDRLLSAEYRDVSSVPIRCADGGGVALVGDAAHAMSPQLGTGASLALADAWTLASCVQTATTVPEALRSYHRARRAHLRWYRWTTRAMTPVFQSDLNALAWARDRFAAPVTRMPFVRNEMVTLFSGVQTSPFTRWQLPDIDR